MNRDTTYGWFTIIALVFSVLTAMCGWDMGFNHGQCIARCAPSTEVHTAEECWCADGRRYPLLSPQEIQ